MDLIIFAMEDKCTNEVQAQDSEAKISLSGLDDDWEAISDSFSVCSINSFMLVDDDLCDAYHDMVEECMSWVFPEGRPKVTKTVEVTAGPPLKAPSKTEPIASTILKDPVEALLAPPNRSLPKKRRDHAPLGSEVPTRFAVFKPKQATVSQAIEPKAYQSSNAVGKKKKKLRPALTPVDRSDENVDEDELGLGFNDIVTSLAGN